MSTARKRLQGLATGGGGAQPWELAVLAGIVLLGGWLRLRALDLAEFKLDEATAVDLARRFLDGSFPTVGLTSSVGARNPPLFVYLTGIPLAIHDDPLAATAFVGILGVAAIALTYVVLRPRFGALVALASPALLATAPWAVLYQRKLWAQSMLPVFTVLLLWALFLVLERRRTRAVLFVPVLLCLVFQLNFSAAALVVPAGLALAYRARVVNWRAFAVGTGIAVLLIAPWLAHEVGNGFDDARTLATEGRSGSGSSTPGAGSVTAIRKTVELTGAFGWKYVSGASQPLLESDAGAAWTLGRLASFLVAALLAIGLCTCVARVVRGARRRKGWPWIELDSDAARRALLVMWLAGVWLSYATSATGRVYPHYFLVSYPISFVVAAIGLSDLAAAVRGRGARAATAVAATTVVAITAGYLAFTVAFHGFLDDHGGTAGDYGVVYHYKTELADVLRERGLRLENDQTVDFLVTGALQAPGATPPLATVRDGLVTTEPQPCDGERRWFGPLEACLPNRG